jgi:hypothetical protein
MAYDNCQPVSVRITIASAQAFDLLGEILPVQRLDFAGAKGARLFKRPREKVVLI